MVKDERATNVLTAGIDDLVPHAPFPTDGFQTLTRVNVSERFVPRGMVAGIWNATPAMSWPGPKPG